MSSHFDEKSGVVACKTSWGKWYQTVDEVVLEIDCEQGTRGKEIGIKIQSTNLSCTVKGKQLFDGKLLNCVIVDESTWSLEDRKLIRIQLVKALKDSNCWNALFKANSNQGGDQKGETYACDLLTFDEMQKKQTLENYQLKHPGFDFSSADISGSYANQ